MNRSDPDYEAAQERARDLARRTALASKEIDAAHEEHHARVEAARKRLRDDEEKSSRQFHADKARIRKAHGIGEGVE